MAARVQCKYCRERRMVGDHEPITSPFCSPRCERDWKAENEPEPEIAAAPQPSQKDLDRVVSLARLAVDGAASPNESANAARAACTILAKIGPIQAPPPPTPPPPRARQRPRPRRPPWEDY